MAVSRALDEHVEERVLTGAEIRILLDAFVEDMETDDMQALSQTARSEALFEKHPQFCLSYPVTSKSLLEKKVTPDQARALVAKIDNK